MGILRGLFMLWGIGGGDDNANRATRVAPLLPSGKEGQSIMKLGDAITVLRRIIGQLATPEELRKLHIEHQALVDVYYGHPFNDQRWNITEAYVYRDAYMRGSLQLELEGRGEIDYIPTKEVER